MSVHDRPMRDTLTLPGLASPSTPPWAVFDASWYRQRYPDAPEGTDEALLAWYRARGQALAHSPNLWFDEAWQRRAWSGIAALIEQGGVESAFDAWCRGAHATRVPHWLFDPVEYRARYPALTEAMLAETGLRDLYDHYLRHGAAEGRIGHALFDPAVYLAALPPDEAARAAAMPFAHYLQGLDQGAPERRTSPLFDPDWYRDQYPEAARAVREGQCRSLLEHYLCNGQPSAFDPSSWFSERHYLTCHPGLAEAIGPEGFRNGFAHFLAHGLREGRSPHPGLDLAWYAARDAVRADLASGHADDAFLHWIAIGHPAGLPGLKPPDTLITEAWAVALHALRAVAVLPSHGRYKLDFTYDGMPRISVIVVARERRAATMASLAALRAHRGDGIDLILIETVPPGTGLDIESQVTGATVLRFGSALSDGAARAAGLLCARAETVLFLGEGVEPAPAAVEAAFTRLTGDPAIGAVGGRLIQPHGVLLEAGGMLWRDGRLSPCLLGGSPLAAEANFVRDTDVCSPLFLMARRAVLTALPDPRPGLTGTTHEAADLCARIQEAGFRVVYDPDALAFLTLPPPPPGPDGQAVFAAAHAAYLAARPVFDPAAMVRARAPDRGKPRVLFIEDTIPLRRAGSGFVRSNDVLRAMADSGAAVTVFPMNKTAFDSAALRAGLPDTVEAMHDASAEDLPAFLAARRDWHDLIWIARTHNLDRVHAALKEQELTGIRVIVDTEAVAAAREAEAALVFHRPFDREAALRQEFRHLGRAAHVLAVTETEAEIIRAHHTGPVSVLGHALAPMPTPRPFEDRAGLLFLGAIHDVTHPNHDGLLWFVEAVLPLIEQALGWRTRLTVAGYTAPGITLDRFRTHPRVTLRGTVSDLRPLYDAHRVFVAPARFAAGLPYKVHEAAAHGVPVVATSLLAGQLGWTDGTALATADAADPVAFAARVVELYNNSELWHTMRAAALARVAAELDPARFAAAVADLIAVRA